MASFQVKRKTKTVVAAALPRTEHWLPQSNLDLLIPHKLEMGVIFCYQKPLGLGHSFDSVVNVLKKALSQVLVPFYALSGEMVLNGAGEPELLCNNRGVDFEEAYADVELRDLNLHKPDESIRGKLMPALNDGIMAVQVTQLSCGGVVVGIAYDHRVADAFSANMFWKSFADMARSNTLSCVPSFRRSLLSPRRPGSFDSSVTNLYIPISEIPPFEQESNESTEPMPVSRIYSVSAEQINVLQQLANHENPSSLTLKRTKFEAFSAFLWKLIASEISTEENNIRIGISIDGRTKIGDGALSNYFGNVISIAFQKKKCGELVGMPLSSIANEINKFLNVTNNQEHFLGLIDFMEAHRPTLVTFRGLGSKVTKEDMFLSVSSARSFPVGKMDFGWGAPAFGSYISPPEVPGGVVFVMPSPSENGDWVIYMRLTEDQFEMIENIAPHVFQPFCI